MKGAKSAKNYRFCWDYCSMWGGRAQVLVLQGFARGSSGGGAQKVGRVLAPLAFFWGAWTWGGLEGGVWRGWKRLGKARGGGGRAGPAHQRNSAPKWGRCTAKM